MIEDCTAIILAGGDSRRMGRDKASLLLGDQTLLQHVIAVMQPIFSEVIVSVRQPRAEINLPQVCDDPAAAGPLAGLAAALGQIKTPWAFVVACDMPFVQAAMIEKLSQYRGDFQAVVPVVQGHVQPLAAFYASSGLEVIRAHLAGGGKNSLRAVLEKISVRYVDEPELFGVGSTRRSFFDLDTPQDVAIAFKDGNF
jgi:molybdopterin-guanine dinucleotide biosynthesis protein A